MLRLALLALLLLVSTSADGSKLVDAVCFPNAVAETAASRVAAREKQEVIDIDGPGAQRYLDTFNAEMDTSLKAARIILIQRSEGGPTLVVFLVSTKAACVVGRVKPALHIRALQASKETPV